MSCNSDCENCPLEKYTKCMKDFDEFERRNDIKQSKAIAEYYECMENGY